MAQIGIPQFTMDTTHKVIGPHTLAQVVSKTVLVLDISNMVSGQQGWVQTDASFDGGNTWQNVGMADFAPWKNKAGVQQTTVTDTFNFVPSLPIGTQVRVTYWLTSGTLVIPSGTLTVS